MRLLLDGMSVTNSRKVVMLLGGILTATLATGCFGGGPGYSSGPYGYNSGYSSYGTSYPYSNYGNGYGYPQSYRNSYSNGYRNADRVDENRDESRGTYRQPAAIRSEARTEMRHPSVARNNYSGGASESGHRTEKK